MPRPFLPGIARASAAILLTARVLHADVFYVTDSGADAVTRINSVGVATPYVDTPSGLVDPQQVVLDGAGNAYVADNSLGKVLRFPAAGGAPAQVGSDVPGITSLAFSPSGVLHVASETDDTIRKLSGNTFVILTTLPANATARSIAFDTTGELYVADSQGNRIFKVTEAGAQSTYSDAVTAPFAVAFDTAGKLHFSDAQDGGRIAGFRGNNGNNTTNLLDNIGAVRGLAFDSRNVAHFLTAGGELKRIEGNGAVLVEDQLGTVQLLTARAPAVNTVALKGQTVPAVNNAALGILGSPAIGNGQVAFKSTLAVSTSVTSANSLALFRSQTDGTLDLLARKSFAAPGMNNGGSTPVMNAFADPVLNHSGRVAFIGTLRAGIGNVTAADAMAVFSDYDGGALRPVLRRNQSELGNGLDPAVKLTAFKQLVLPDDSGPAVLATIEGPGVPGGTNLALFSVDLAGNLSLVVRSGTMITAGGKSRKLGTLTLFSPTLLSLGQARHFGEQQTFTLVAKFTDGFTAILRVKPGMAPEVLLEKSADVGAAIPSAKLSTLGSPAMADDGTIALRATLLAMPGFVTAATASVILSQDVATAKVARSGDSAPDVDDAFFASLSDPVVSPSGGIAFFGKLKPGLGDVTTATVAGLWQNLGAGVHNAVRQSDPAAGVPGAVKYTAFKQFVLPASGGVVFTATIGGEAITSANNLGIWANDGAGATELLLRKGTKLMIGGKSRTVTAFKIFALTLGVSGQSRQFDANGAITCFVSCSDGAQAIVAIQRP